MGKFVGEVRTVFKSELDKQVSHEARGNKDDKIHEYAKSHNGDADDGEEDQEEAEKVNWSFKEHEIPGSRKQLPDGLGMTG